MLRSVVVAALCWSSFGVCAQGVQLSIPAPRETYEEEGGKFTPTRLFSDGTCFTTRRRALLFHDKIVTDRSSHTLSSNYSRHKYVLKSDIVCVGDEIVVDEPIFTNGGDVFIHATKLVVSAPIDTRIYLEQFPNVDPFIPDQDPRKLPVPEQVRNVMRLYEAYYRGCQTCDLSLKDTKLPRLPSGLVGSVANNAKSPGYPGFSAPDPLLDISGAQSGSIIIAASNVTATSAGVGDQASPLLQVSGMDGGLGGPGSVATCGGRVAIRWACTPDNAYKNSGYSSTGGKGGNAG